MCDNHNVVRCDIGTFRVKELLRRLQFLPKLLGTYQYRLPGRIKKEPWLVVFENGGICAKIILQVLPGDWRGDQTMNKEDRNLVWIVGMSQVNAGRKPRGIGSEK